MWARPAARYLQSLAAVVLVAGGLTMATPATAQSVASIDIHLAAVIPERCGFSPIVQAADVAADLEQAQILNFVLPLDCNTPFAVGISAEHGGLVNLTSAPDRSGYAFAKTYGVRLTLRTSDGEVRSERCLSTDITIGGTCAFASDQPGRGLGSGAGVAAPGDVTLTIDWPDQSTLNRRLAAGDYSDTITLVVGARA
ncbi:MAG: hypothetical protein ACK4JY_04600 [Brevundimonas sp.]|uniref:hypothetical protein n=1 Tax=Brevundimonas sp. TaxID=1871086 RepID=UPI00391DA358